MGHEFKNTKSLVHLSTLRVPRNDGGTRHYIWMGHFIEHLPGFVQVVESEGIGSKPELDDVGKEMFCVWVKEARF